MVDISILEARRSLIQQAFNEIFAERDMNRFYSNTYCVFMKLWLLKKAEEEGIFNPKEDWFNPELRNILLKKVKKFLIKYIR
jgi:hypothetical protein